MGYALIWVEGLAAAVLWVALGAVWGARRQRRLWQIALAVLVALLPLSLAVAAVWAAFGLKFEGRGTIATDWTWYSLSWAVVFLVCMTVVLRRGLKRHGEEQAPAARSWPAGQIALVLGLALTLQGITLSNMDLAMKLRLASARSEAGAVLQALSPPRVPEKDNAAPVYRQAFAALTPDDQLPPQWRTRAQEWLYPEQPRYRQGTSKPLPPVKFDPKDRDVNEYLASQEAGLGLLRKAAAMPGCWLEQQGYPVADTEALGRDAWYFPELRQMGHGARLLALSARVRAANGDAKGALADVAAILGIARHMPAYLLTFPAINGAETLGLRTLAEVMEQTDPKPEDLAGVPLEDQPYHAWLRREEAILAVICIAVLTVEPGTAMAREMMFEDLPEFVVGLLDGTVFPLGRVFLAPDDLAAARRAMRDYQRPARGSDDRPLKEFAEEVKTRPSGLFTMLYLTPKMQKLTHDAGEVATLRRVAQTAVAAERYRAKQGKYPEKASDLVPEYLPRVPVDPWDGEPIQVLRQGEGLAVYARRWKPGVEESPYYSTNRTPLGITLR